MTMEASLSMESCLMEDQSGRAGAEGLSAEESFRASLVAEPDTMAMEAAEAVSGVAPPPIHRTIQCRAATPMARGKHNIDTIILHTPEGHVPGTLSVLSETRAGFDWYLPPSGELYKCNDYTRFASWHAGDWAYNKRSIGIEQWDFAQNMPNAPDAHYQRLARLCAYLVETLDLAIRHAKNYGDFGFIAHGTVTPHARWDPGKFDYEKLLSLVSDLVKGRSVSPITEPPVEKSPNGGSKKLWLPGLERIAAGDFDEEDLEGACVMTLDGADRAVIVPKGVAIKIPRPGEIPDPIPDKPILTEPDDPNGIPDPESKRLASVIDAYFSSLPSTLMPYSPVGATIVDEAKKANLHITSACALVEQESAGRNVFGADWGTRGMDGIPFAHLPVTESRVKSLVSHIRNGGTSNGVGLTQITWRDFIFDAEGRGGAHLPKNQCAVGFELLAGYYGKYPYLEAIGAYNAGETNRRNVIHTYSAQFAAKHEAWRARLGKAASGIVGEAPPKPSPETFAEPSPVVTEPELPEPETPETSPTEPLGETPKVETPPDETPKDKPPKDKVPMVAPTPSSPGIGRAAKAIVAAVVPLVGALLLWAQTGTLDETEFSVGLTGLLTALLVYLVPNTTDPKTTNTGDPS